MTIATNIAEYTSYESGDITSTILAATRLLAKIDLSDDESIEIGAVWLLERLLMDRKARSDSTIIVPSMKDFYKFMKGIISVEKDEVLIVHKFTSPSRRNKAKWFS